nr:MAG TPA: hypothetical protein [Caudoviricetes sp.]
MRWTVSGTLEPDYPYVTTNFLKELCLATASQPIIDSRTISRLCTRYALSAGHDARVLSMTRFALHFRFSIVSIQTRQCLRSQSQM